MLEPIFGMLLGLSWIPLYYLTRSRHSVVHVYCFIYSIPSIILGASIFSGIPIFLAGGLTPDLNLLTTTTAAFFFHSILSAGLFTFIVFAVIDVNGASRSNAASANTYFCVANVILSICLFSVAFENSSPPSSPRYEVVIDKVNYGLPYMNYEASLSEQEPELKKAIHEVRSSCYTANIAFKSSKNAVLSCIQNEKMAISTPYSPFDIFSLSGTVVSENVSRVTVAPLNDQQVLMTIYTTDGRSPLEIHEVDNILGVIFDSAEEDVTKIVNDAHWGALAVKDKEVAQ